MKAKLSGKQKCEMLRRIRREIADRNNIEFLSAECTYEGDCRGTCPKCDAEVRYLEFELNRKSKEGQQVTYMDLNDCLVDLIDEVEMTVNDSGDKKTTGRENELFSGWVPPEWNW